MAGTIGGSPSFLQWFESISGISQIGDIFSPQQIPSESPWISKSERKRVEDILALMPPPPMINFATFHEISLHFPEHFRIGHAGSVGSELTSFGLVESSMLLGAAGAWAGAQVMGGLLATELMHSEQQNPLQAAIEQYMNNSGLYPLDVRGTLNALRSLPFTFALLHSVDPDVVSQGFRLAEQQIVLSILDKWVEAIAQQAETQRIEMKQLDIQHQQILSQILRNYIENTQEKQEAMAQPTVSILISAMAFGPMLVPVVHTLLPGLAGVAGVTSAVIGSVPPVLQAELTAIVSGVIATVSAWATPIAMALTGKPGGGTASELNFFSAKAYALTLSSFVTGQEFDNLLTNRLDQAVATGLIDQHQADRLRISIKTALLLTAMAVLYNAETGGLSAQELRGIIEGTVELEEGNFLKVLAKLVNEQLDQLPPEEREAFLNELLGPYDKDVSLSEFTDPIATFVRLWDPTFLEKMNLENLA
jgi:hypothetical protein